MHPKKLGCMCRSGSLALVDGASDSWLGRLGCGGSIGEGLSWGRATVVDWMGLSEKEFIGATGVREERLWSRWVGSEIDLGRCRAGFGTG